jgi:hypothetical protein
MDMKPCLVMGQIALALLIGTFASAGLYMAAAITSLGISVLGVAVLIAPK